jgi:tetratricopeptide (TPR) repeat protein
MKSNRIKTSVLIGVVLLGFSAIFGLSRFLEINRPPLPEGYADTDSALQGANLKGYALGFEGLIADWYWMQSLQYIGDKLVKSSDTNINIDNLQNLNPRLLYPYLDNATTLDPKFTAVYEYGANVLPAIDPEKAVALTEKGIADNPDNWRLYHYLGYTHWKLKNYEKAAESYDKGSAIKDAPAWMKLMSAKMKSEGGSRETARSIYTQMSESAADQQTKESAALRLLELDSLDERDAIRSALKTFRDKTNRCANGWSEILPLLKNIKLPSGKDFRVDNAFNLIDPSGAAYILDKEICEVKLDLQTTKIPAR